MAGWSFTITRQTPEDYRRRPDREAVVARWTVGAMGIRWNEELAGSGDAERVERGGYPNLYAAPARVIAPLLADGEPPSHDTGRMFGPREVGIKRDELDRCAPDQALTIAAWDQS